MTAKRVLLGLAVLLAATNTLVTFSFGTDPHPAIGDYYKCERYERYFDVPGWYPAAWIDDPACGEYFEDSATLVMFTWVPLILGGIAAWEGCSELSSWREARSSGRLRGG